MPLDVGTKLGTFEITAPLGEGGMGEVYRARDSKLGREVAIKVLSDTFSEDAEMLARFEQEALNLARLDHPNIGGIYDFQHSGEMNYLVMQLVEGHTLADRISLGPVPTGEATTIFLQIAEALEAAHEAGIVHRDLKPANIKVDDDNRIKVLDFGIAKQLNTGSAVTYPTPTPSGRVDPDAPTRAVSPTPSSGITADGSFVGTPHYMSPEQARGRQVDRRTDIWAFGICLYEALTGQMPYDGDTMVDVMTSILRDDPDLSALAANTPANVQRLLDRCLIKDPKYRLRDIGEAWVMLNSDCVPESVAQNDRPSLPSRFSFKVPEKRIVAGFRPPVRVSPNAQMLSVETDRGGDIQLYLRHLDRLELEEISIPDTVRWACFSPDSKSMAIGGENKIWQYQIESHHAEIVCDVPGMLMALLWTGRDEIVWSSIDTGLCATDLRSKETRVLIAPDADSDESVYIATGATQDGEWILVCTDGGPGKERPLECLSALTGERQLLLENGNGATLLRDGHLLYCVRDRLYRTATEGKPPKPIGDSVEVARNVMTGSMIPVGFFDACDDRVLTYVEHPKVEARGSLSIVSRNGNRNELALPENSYLGPRISPDGDSCAVVAVDAGGRQQIFLYEIDRGMIEALTRGALPAVVPVWGHDGAKVYFTSPRTRPPRIEQISLNDDSTGVFAQAERALWPSDCSRDGQHVLAAAFDDAGDIDLVVVHSDGSIERLLKDGAKNITPRFCPTGKFFAYASDDGGGWQVYVRPFGSGGRRYQISLEGGIEPVWSADGEELFYRNGKTLYAVSIAREPRFRAGRPEALFEFPFDEAPSVFSPAYDVFPDGQRFIISDAVAQARGAEEVVVVQNWHDELNS